MVGVVLLVAVSFGTFALVAGATGGLFQVEGCATAGDAFGRARREAPCPVTEREAWTYCAAHEFEEPACEAGAPVLEEDERGGLASWCRQVVGLPKGVHTCSLVGANVGRAAR